MNQKFKIYMAPMEGVTGYVFRSAYEKCFPGVVDTYFTPFLAASRNRTMSTREKNDILPANNQRIRLVPQIMTADSVAFFNLTYRLIEYGYHEVNLNLGCPSQTVVSKGKGSALLRSPEGLKAFLDEIFTDSRVSISVKTRIGFQSPEEWPELFSILNSFPFCEIVIHPRTREEYYNSVIHPDSYLYAEQISKVPLCYNGNVFTVDDFNKLGLDSAKTKAVMLGRGLITNPGLASEYKENLGITLCKLNELHDLILEGYQKQMSGDTCILFKMKELWSFWSRTVTNGEKHRKEIDKTQNLCSYCYAVRDLFQTEELKEKSETE